MVRHDVRQRRAHADSSYDDLCDVRDDDHGAGEADERSAALHRGVVQHVLQVERQEEELRERNGTHDRHRRVRCRKRA